MVGWIQKISLVVAVVACSASLGSAAPKQDKVPEGYGKAKFGMSVAQTKAVYPHLEPAPKVAGYLAHPDLQRFVLYGVTLKGLKDPVDIELRFWKDHLWMFLFYTGKNSGADVDAYLIREYGPPASTGLDPAWVWPGRSLVRQTKHGWFSLADKDLGREAQSALAQRRTPAPDEQ